MHSSKLDLQLQLAFSVTLQLFCCPFALFPVTVTSVLSPCLYLLVLCTEVAAPALPVTVLILKMAEHLLCPKPVRT
jgi:hypothetical protein